MGKTKQTLTSTPARLVSSTPVKSSPSHEYFTEENELDGIYSEWRQVIVQAAKKHFPGYECLSIVDHNWCADTCDEIAEQIPELTVTYDAYGGYKSFGDPGYAHVWLEAEDGTIIDPTVSQFMVDSSCYELTTYIQEAHELPTMEEDEFKFHYWVVPEDDPRADLYMR